MALVKATLEAELLSIFSQSNSAEDAASQLATAIDNYIRSATVTTTVNVLSVTGVTTGPGISGPGTGTGTGTLT